MLTRWFTFTAFLAASAHPERAAIGRGTLTVAPTCRVKGHPAAELTLNCGDGKNAGVVQYWHTPFGGLQIPGFHSKLDPVFMHLDGSLVVPNTSILHSGVYYCLLQHTQGTTLWPYELHVGDNNQKTQEHGTYKQCGAFRFRRDVGSVEETQAGASDAQFAGAVVASVLLTFVVGFGAGALTRTRVLRCLGAVGCRLRSPQPQQCPTDMAIYDSEVTMTTLPPMYDNQAFDQVWDDDDDRSANCTITDTTISSTSSCPPAKPQRSFRQKRQEEQETTYLEGCDYMKESEGSLKEKNKGCDVEAEGDGELSGFYPVGEEKGRQTETDEDKCSDDIEEREREKSREEEKEWRREEEKEWRREEEQEWRREEEAGTQENRSEGEKRGSEEVDDGERRQEDEETDICSKDHETGGNQQDAKKGFIGGREGETSPTPCRRSRVIRLYQYDEDGQRYGHLQDSDPNKPCPPPMLKQRSLSLTRLNTIMATASAGPLDIGETGRGERAEAPHFHMEI